MAYRSFIETNSDVRIVALKMVFAEHLKFCKGRKFEKVIAFPDSTVTPRYL